MIDSSDALLLRPARAETGFSLDVPERRPPLDSALPAGIVVATVHSLEAPADAEFLGFVEDAVNPLLVRAGAIRLGSFVTEHSPNNFPRHELREGENVFVSFHGFRDLTAYHVHLMSLGRNREWRSEVYPDLMRRIRGRPQILRLAPTSRSQLRA